MVRILLSSAGALSLFVLIARSGAFLVGPTGAMIISTYDMILSSAIGWVEPLIAELMSPPKYFDHWKHVFVVLWLYFGASAINAWELRVRDGAVFRAIWGTVVSFPASIIASLTPIENTKSILIPLSFAIALFVYGMGLAAWHATTDRRKVDGQRVPWLWSFWYHLAPPFRMSFIALFVLALGDWLLMRGVFFEDLNFGLIALVVIIFSLGIYWIGYGSLRRRRGDVRLGVTIMFAIAGALGLLALFATLNSIGI